MTYQLPPAVLKKAVFRLSKLPLETREYNIYLRQRQFAITKMLQYGVSEDEVRLNFSAMDEEIAEAHRVMENPVED